MKIQQITKRIALGLLAVTAISFSSGRALGAEGEDSPAPRGAVDASRNSQINNAAGGEEAGDQLPDLPPSRDMFEQQGPEAVEASPVAAESAAPEADGEEAPAAERGRGAPLEHLDPFAIPVPGASEAGMEDPSFERWLVGSSDGTSDRSGQRREKSSDERRSSESVAAQDSSQEKSSAAGNDMWQLMGIVALCAVAAALLMAAPVLVRRYLPGGARLFGGEVVRILGRAHLGPKHSVHVIRVGDRVLVLGVADGSVRTLSELTEPEEVTRLMASANGVSSEAMLDGEVDTEVDTEADAEAGAFAGGPFARLLRRERSSYGSAGGADREVEAASAETLPVPALKAGCEAGVSADQPQRVPDQPESVGPSAESRAFASVLRRSRATMGSLQTMSAVDEPQDSSDEVVSEGGSSDDRAEERVAKARDEVERIRDVLSTLRGRL